MPGSKKKIRNPGPRLRSTYIVRKGPGRYEARAIVGRSRSESRSTAEGAAAAARAAREKAAE